MAEVKILLENIYMQIWYKKSELKKSKTWVPPGNRFWVQIYGNVDMEKPMKKRICQRKYAPKMLSCRFLVPHSLWGIWGDDDLEGLVKTQLTLQSSTPTTVTSAVTSAIISTRSAGRRIQLTRCLRTSCTAVNFDYEEIVDPVPHRKYLQVNTAPYA